jgi:hypothetical protein
MRKGLRRREEHQAVVFPMGQFLEKTRHPLRTCLLRHPSGDGPIQQKYIEKYGKNHGRKRQPSTTPMQENSSQQTDRRGNGQAHGSKIGSNERREIVGQVPGASQSFPNATGTVFLIEVKRLTGSQCHEDRQAEAGNE